MTQDGAGGPDEGEEKPRWTYDPGEGRVKHRWNRREAGHVRQGNRVIGKCPKDLDYETAEEALNTGYEYYSRRGGDEYPSQIYAVIDGVVYRAEPTMNGISYHGFPVLPGDIPPGREVRDAILGIAELDGSREEVAKWLRKKR